MMHLPFTYSSVFLAILLAHATIAQAAVVAEYLAPGGSFVPTTTLPGLTASSLNATGSAATLEPDVSQNEVLVRTTQAGGGAFASNQYLQFTITPNVGVTVTLDSLSFTGGYGGTGSVSSFSLRTSLDGFTGNSLSGNFNVATIANSTRTASFGGIVLSGPITFRLYNSTPNANEVVFYDNIRFNGTVVPEPASLAILGLGGMALAAARRSRRA